MRDRSKISNDLKAEFLICVGCSSLAHLHRSYFSERFSNGQLAIETIFPSTFIFLQETIFHFPSFLYINIYVSVFQSKLLVVAQLRRPSTAVVSYENYTSNYNKYNAFPTFARDESLENTSRVIRRRTTMAIKTTNDARNERKYHIVEISAK